MKKSIKILLLTFTILMVMSIIYTVNAASASLGANSTTIKVGESTSVYASISGTEAWQLSMSATGGSLSGNTNNADAYGEEKSLTALSATFTAGKAGSYTISLSGSVTGSDLNPVGVGKSITINVIENTTPPPSSSNNSGSSSSSSSSNNKPSTPETPKPEVKKSSDSKLKSLAIAEGAISPEFSSDIKEYTLSVPNEIIEISVAGTTNHSKATYSVSGNKELQVGDNKVSVVVKAEDGTTTTYTITVNRARAELALQSLIVSFTDENGVITELPLTPLFSFDVYEYTMEKLAHTIEKLNIEALANLEGATVKIEGNEGLKEGENKITITITMPAETSPETGEVIREEEEKTYTITLEKEAAPIVVPPTFWEKVKNWFAGIGGWIGNNIGKIQTGTLMFCSAAMVALSIYLIIDYKKYKALLIKVKQLTEINSTNEPISELTTIDENNNDVENTEIIQEENIETNEQKKKTGRHF